MAASIPAIHDAFFKSCISRRERASLFLREHLPSPIAELLSSEPPEPLPGSFVDEALSQHHSDLLFRLPLKADQDALAYVLFEHKSSRDPLTRLQLLRYIVRILAKWYDDHGKLPLPLVVPFVVHQGPGEWKLSTEFIDLFGNIPTPLLPFALTFRHALADLPLIPDEQLSVDTTLRARLRALKYGRRDDLPQQLRLILDPDVLDVDLEAILHYINHGPITVTPEILRAALRGLGHARAERIMGHFTQEYEARGRVQGEAHALVRLLEKRFGTVPPHARERISSADLATLETWFDRALESPDLDSVFPSTEIQ